MRWTDSAVAVIVARIVAGIVAGIVARIVAPGMCLGLRSVFVHVARQLCM